MLTHNALRNNTFEVSSSERDVLERAIKHTAAYPPGHVAVRQGVEVDVSLLFVKGFMTRHKTPRMDDAIWWVCMSLAISSICMPTRSKSSTMTSRRSPKSRWQCSPMPLWMPFKLATHGSREGCGC